MMKLLVFGLTLLSISQAWKTYRGYRTYKVTPNTEEQLKNLRHLLSEDIELDVWKPSFGVGDEAHVMVSPEKRHDFAELMVRNGLSLGVHIADVGDDVADIKARMDARRKPDGRLAFDLTDFNTLEDTYDQMNVWAANCPSGIICEVQSIGKSHLDEDVFMFKMTNGGTNNKKIYIDSLTHCREMLSGTTVNNFINKLVVEYGSDVDVTYILDNYDVFLVPVVNPDGYKYVWSDEAMWRKNREPNSGSACVGTDLNRNFDTGCWNCDGTSSNPCSDTYGGSGPASAIETQNVQNFLDANTPEIMISIHSYARMWLQPYGHTSGIACVRANNHQDMLAAGQAAIEAIMAYGGQSWEAGTVCETIYPASGGTVDYAHSVGSLYSYTPELRGTSFWPSDTLIGPAFEETWEGIVALVYETESHKNTKE